MRGTIERSMANAEQAIIGRIESMVRDLVDQKSNEILSRVNEKMNEAQPQQGMIFNYAIPEPDGEKDFESAVAMEINFNSPTLHVLGLQNKELKWIATEDC